MNAIRIAAWVVPLALIALGCERQQGPDRIADPTPAVSTPSVSEARWVWDKDLDLAVRSAAVSPLVRRTLAESPHPAASPLWRHAVRAEGVVSDGSKVSVTILPYAPTDDPTHALFLSVIHQNGQERVESSELIVGRRPKADETGFEAITQGSEVLWVKNGSGYVVGSAGMSPTSPERVRWARFFSCFMDRAPGYCATGAEIGGIVAPGVPQARAVGCGAGLAVAAGECALTSR
jgi:hypothetical protein